MARRSAARDDRGLSSRRARTAPRCTADRQAGRLHAGTKYPTLLLIHGGPNGQDQHAFTFEREFFAANGYVVSAVNYRGSAGRGRRSRRRSSATGATWKSSTCSARGLSDQEGIADPERLGIGGWSYGGILTDYTIASDPRFKAAISGAGSALQITMYGIDQYIVQYETGDGPPWKSKDAWMKVSYPFFNADRIKTPTLFMGGEKDFNVPAPAASRCTRR